MIHDICRDMLELLTFQLLYNFVAFTIDINTSVCVVRFSNDIIAYQQSEISSMAFVHLLFPCLVYT